MTAEKREGFVHIYTGEGKGKTTAALGLTLRAVGAGWRVLFAQFLKRGESSEIKALRRLGDAVEVLQFGSGHFVRGTPSETDRNLARSGLRQIEQALAGGRYQLIVLDEINVAADMGILTTEDMLSLLDARPAGVELVLTGRNAPKAIMDRADLITEMREIRHYFRRGVQARVGIEM